MKDILELLSRFIFHDSSLLSTSKGPTFLRLAANLTAFFLLVFVYVLGCKVLYHYIKPLWGEDMSLLAICGLLLATSLILFIFAWALKPKKPQPANLIAEVEKTIDEISSHEIVKKVGSLITPKAVMAAFTVAFITSYFTNFKKHI